MPTRTHFPKSRTALLLVDTINPFDFDGGTAFARKALRTATAILRLRERASAAGVPVIYVNDNLGRWRSDIGALVAWCSRPGSPGAAVVDMLKPRKSDYVILKASLSGFYDTALQTMLRLGDVRTVVLTGFATDNCVLFTAADAYMREYEVMVPRDCVAAKTAEAQRRALTMMKSLFDANTRASNRIRFHR